MITATELARLSDIANILHKQYAINDSPFYEFASLIILASCAFISNESSLKIY